MKGSTTKVIKYSCASGIGGDFLKQADFNIIAGCKISVGFITWNVVRLQFIAESHIGVVISQMAGWEKIFVTSKTERYAYIPRNSYILAGKKEMDVVHQFRGRENWTTNKYINKCSNSWGRREIKVQRTRRYYFSCSRLSKWGNGVVLKVGLSRRQSLP